MDRPSELLTLKFRPGLRLSDAAFAKLCAANPELRLERSARGALEIMTPAGADSGRRNALLTMRLVNWAEADGHGLAFDSSAGFRLPNGATRAPDASWIERTRWEALSGAERDDFSPICPAFVVELRSRTDRMSALRIKVQEFIDQGARLGWLIDPQGGAVEVFRPGRTVEVLDHPAFVAGDPELPGFVLDLKGILSD